MKLYILCALMVIPLISYSPSQKYAGEINLFSLNANDRQMKYAITFNPATWRLAHDNQNKLLEFIESPKDCTLILNPSIQEDLHEGELPQTIWISEKGNFENWISVDGKVLPECIEAIKNIQKTAKKLNPKPF